MTKLSDSPLDPSIEPYINAALGKKAINVIALDLRKVTSFTDFFIICCGRSNRQVSAIAEHINVDLKKHGIRPFSIEGMKEGHWILLDYGHIVIHVFYEPVRDFYDLEGLWSDAEKIQTDTMKKTNTSKN
jgi:ribosome-associated protein